MNRQKNIQIGIPHPCSQNWDEMTPSGGGRFCDQCQKTVIDFTEWSDGPLHQFLSKNKEHVCGRFMSTQVDRPISIPVQPHNRLYRLAVAFGLTIVIANGQQAQARKMPPLVEQRFYGFSDDTTKVKGTDTTGSISGMVLDEKKEPLIGTLVAVYLNDTLKGANVVDFDGNYVISSLEPGLYKVVATAMGFDSVVVTEVNVSHNVSVLNLSMQRDNSKNKNEPIRMIYMGKPVMEFNPNKHTYTRDDLDHRW